MKNNATLRHLRLRRWAGLFAPPVASLLLLAACSSAPSGSTAGTGGGASTGSGSGSMSTGSTMGTGGSTGTGGGGGGGGFDPEAGWTTFTPNADTHKIYVSSSKGADANDGLTPATAVKTIAAGIKLIRAGHPDWLLLQRGDSWGETLGSWSRSGLDAKNPILISYYGDMASPRPLLKTGAQTAMFLNDNATVNYVAVVGLHFYADARDPASPTFDAALPGKPGVYWLSTSDGILLEDMEIAFYTDNIVLQGDAAHHITNAAVRRSVLTDAWEVTGKNAEGMYLETVDNLLIEENVFDHNGWNETAPKATKTIFNHNVYIQADCTSVTFQKNLSARASSHGVQVRPGGKAVDNLFVRDPLAMSFGLDLGGHAPTPGGVTGEVSGNVILEGDDIDGNAGIRGYGIQLGNIKSASVHDNIIAHNTSAKPSYGAALQLTEGTGIGLHNLTLTGDIIYDWQGLSVSTSYTDPTTMMVYPTVYENVTLQKEAVQVGGSLYLVQYYGNTVSPQIHFLNNLYDSTNPAGSWFFLKSGTQSLTEWAKATGDTSQASKVKYKDPKRTLDTYHASIGKTGTFAAYIVEARKQAHGDYRYEYTPAAAIAYIRDGFTVVP